MLCAPGSTKLQLRHTSFQVLHEVYRGPLEDSSCFSRFASWHLRGVIPADISSLRTEKVG